jgi:hypothetical protein
MAPAGSVDLLQCLEQMAAMVPMDFLDIMAQVAVVAWEV